LSFIDEAKIKVKAGDGGRGCFSFYFNRRTGKNYPDGGDGGKGGDVIISCNPNLWDLTHLKYKKSFRAKNGAHGSSNKKKGKNGNDVIIEVPLGTIVKDLKDNIVIKDVVSPQDKFIVAKGGKGGRGNAYTRAEPIPPQAGEEKELFLELKLLAHVGLVGLPNSGKTTLLNSLCQTRCKTADYPFTTLEPALGVIWDKDTAIKIADIPGLIQGAHKGKGLGDRFLRHIQRTQLLIFLLGLGHTDPEPLEAFKILKRELKLYDPDLIKKGYFIVANKIDLPESQEKLKILKKELKREKILAISALKKLGLEELKKEIVNYFSKKDV
jgi:GTP-binding protein